MRIPALVAAFFSILAFSCGTKDSVKADQANSLGLRLSSENKTREALQAFYQAASYKAIADTDRAVYLGNLAVTYEDLDLIDSAKYYYTLAANTTPSGSLRNLVSRSCILLIDNKIDSALRLLNAAYSISGTDLTVNNNIGLIYLGLYDSSFYDPQKALPYNIRVEEMGTNDGDSKLVLAKNYYYLNRMHEALALFRELHKLYPEDVENLHTLIMVEQEMGNKAKADILLDKLKTMNREKYNERIEDPISAGSHDIIWN
jgi:tetratricopeptide (TPR) repeat protein